MHTSSSIECDVLLSNRAFVTHSKTLVQFVYTDRCSQFSVTYFFDCSIKPIFIDLNSSFFFIYSIYNKSIELM